MVTVCTLFMVFPQLVFPVYLKVICTYRLIIFHDPFIKELTLFYRYQPYTNPIFSEIFYITIICNVPYKRVPCNIIISMQPITYFLLTDSICTTGKTISQIHLINTPYLPFLQVRTYGLTGCSCLIRSSSVICSLNCNNLGTDIL